MAFSSKIGSILKQSIIQNSAVSMMNSMRCMFSTKLFVGGLSFQTDDGQLKEAFSEFGEVTEARVITDRDTGRSRGFGFVNYTDSESANSAISSLDNQELNGRNIRVSLANERAPRGGGFGGGGSGYGSGGGGYQGGGGGGGYQRGGRGGDYGGSKDDY